MTDQKQKLTKEEQERVALIHRMGREDLFMFGKSILKNPFLAENVHGEIAKWLDGPYNCPACGGRLLMDILHPPRIEKGLDGRLLPVECPYCGLVMIRGKRFKLLLIPRDCLKTTFVTTYRTLHTLIRDPNCRILIASEVRDLAQSILGAIKATIEYNELFKLYYGDLDGGKKNYKWMSEALTVATRTDWSAKEHSIETAGIDVTITGRHYKKIIIDDPHSQNNSRTKDQIEKVVEWIKLLMPMLEDDGEMIVVGTRWDDNDAYNWVMQLIDAEGTFGEKGDKMFDIFVRSATKEDGAAYYPMRNSLPSLAQKRATMGDYLYSCQYENDPAPAKGALFDTQEIKWIPARDVPPNLFRVILVDVASMDAKELMSANRDDTAMVCLGIEPAEDMLGLRKVFWLDAMAGDWDLDQAIEALTGMFLRNRPNVVGIEKQGMSMFGRQVLARVESRGSFIKIHDLKPRNRSKDQRIATLGPFVNNGYAHFVMDVKTLEDMAGDMRRYPKGRKRDLIDASAYLEDMLSEFKGAIKAMGARAHMKATQQAIMQRVAPADPETGY